MKFNLKLINTKQSFGNGHLTVRGKLRVHKRSVTDVTVTEAKPLDHRNTFDCVRSRCAARNCH